MADHSWCGCLDRKDRYGNIDPCDLALKHLEDQGERTMGTDRYGPHDQTLEFQRTISDLARERQLLRRLGGELADAARPLGVQGSLRRALAAWDEATGERRAA